jgi:hypothetical protein
MFGIGITEIVVFVVLVAVVAWLVTRRKGA